MCCCGIPHQQATRYGIIDILLGALSAAILGIHIREEYLYPDLPESSNPQETPLEGYGTIENEYQPPPPRTFKNFDILPIWLVITILVCHGVQVLLGFVLYYAAGKRKRVALQFWLVITGLTALFTGFIIRICEMVIVNKFARELELLQEGAAADMQPNGGRAIYPVRNHESKFTVETEEQPNRLSRSQPDGYPIHTLGVCYVGSSTTGNTDAAMTPSVNKFLSEPKSHSITNAFELPPKYEDTVKENMPHSYKNV